MLVKASRFSKGKYGGNTPGLQLKEMIGPGLLLFCMPTFTAYTGT